jgi:hypothetical protein
MLLLGLIFVTLTTFTLVRLTTLIRGDRPLSPPRSHVHEVSTTAR